MHISDQKSSDFYVKFITSTYINHPWFVENNFHYILGFVAYRKKTPLGSSKSDYFYDVKVEPLGTEFIIPSLWNNKNVHTLLKSRLDAFVKKHQCHPFEILEVSFLLFFF